MCCGSVQSIESYCGEASGAKYYRENSICTIEKTALKHYRENSICTIEKTALKYYRENSICTRK